ncbi:MAG TPA: DNA polymerase III subunit delta [Ignavibacteriaceae bacterium]|nr:DNA polymerase III subunit delta [Ignavibacteriaceae bacterium]
MAKSKAPSILEAVAEIKKRKFNPVYYFFGEDSYNLSLTLHTLEEAFQPLLLSEFDKETIYSEDRAITDILGLATSFPFGSEKKLIIVKEAEKIKDKKPLKDYVASPAEFTVIAFFHNGSITNLNSEPFKALDASGYLYEAKELKGKNLIDWLISIAEEKGKKLSEENAQVLVDIVGENRNMLEDQLEKICIFLNEKKEITIESIQQVSSELKQFNIFDLQNAIGVKDKSKALTVANNLLDNGTEPTFIITMLTRYFTGLAKITELQTKNTPVQEAARIVGTHHFYYPNYVKARKLYSDEKLVEVFRALLKADVSIKTTTSDDKTIITLLIAEILQ